MFEGAKITKQLIKEIKKSYIDMSLYELLQKNGYKNPLYPEKYIDRLSEKYKFVNFFHKTKKISEYRVLSKNGISIFFDDWNVDVSYDNKYVSFGKHAIDEGIIEYINVLEYKELIKKRELKLSRII